MTEAMAEEFQKQNKDIKVTVGIGGRGGGFKKFCRGETDISNASRPITSSEQKACKEAGIEYIELPVALDALTVIVQPVQYMGQRDDRCGAEEDLGARGPRQDHQLEVSPRQLPRSSAGALRSRCRFRHLRLFHRRHRRQGTLQPRRLHRFGGRQRARAGRRR
ncbi:substrate-binding domain-containing protein [Xanthobacter wiegelii]|uniref:substrate-binding domain-containing protein n=1 Tax=Xanthobacter wiegelii TaxID=3119913 RepID=UPI00372A5E72